MTTTVTIAVADPPSDPSAVMVIVFVPTCSAIAPVLHENVPVAVPEVPVEATQDIDWIPAVSVVVPVMLMLVESVVIDPPAGERICISGVTGAAAGGGVIGGGVASTRTTTTV